MRVYILALYGLSHFEARREARRLYAACASCTSPPVSDITKGIKRRVFNLTNVLFVHPLLCIFMDSIAV